MARMTAVQAFWGHRTKLNQASVDDLPVNGVTDSAAGDWLWTLRCDCGQEFELLAKSFPGRRRMRDCGGRNPECPFASSVLRPRSESKLKLVPSPRRPTGNPPGRPRVTDPGVSHSFYLPHSLMEELKMRAEAGNVSLNRVLVDLVRMGQAYELVGQ